MAFRPEYLAIEAEAQGFPLAQRLEPLARPGTGDPKKSMRVLVNKGAAIRSCPGTREYICCGYQILHVGTGCPMDCSYCVLQSYLNENELRVFANWDYLISAVTEASRERPDLLYRLGTGEFTDSLYADHLTGFSLRMAPVIQRTPNMVLEFKTKTVNIENLLRLDSVDRIIVSFSLNSRQMARNEEHRAAAISTRLEAAQRLQDKGFKLGFHFDPLIHYPGWREGYAEVIEDLFRAVDPSNVIWISLGCLRFMPQLKAIIKERFPKSPIIYDEFIIGLDGKMRYFNPIRLAMFGFVHERIKERAPDALVYLCMESNGIWQKSTGNSPGDSEGLRKRLDRRALDFFPSLDLRP